MMEGCFFKLRGLDRVSFSMDSGLAWRFRGDLELSFSVAVKKFRFAAGIMSLTLLFLFSGVLRVEGDVLLMIYSSELHSEKQSYC